MGKTGAKVGGGGCGLVGVAVGILVGAKLGVPVVGLKVGAPDKEVGAKLRVGSKLQEGANVGEALGRKVGGKTGCAVGEGDGLAVPPSTSFSNEKINNAKHALAKRTKIWRHLVC